MARTADDVRRLRPDRIPPQNLEAEESVLGAMMLSGEAIADVVEVVKPEDFYKSANAKIFVDHGDPLGHATIIPSPEARRDEALVLRGFLTAALLDQEP